MERTNTVMIEHRIKNKQSTPSYPLIKDMESINTLSQFLAKYREVNKDNEEYAIDWLRMQLYQTANMFDIIQKRTLPMLGKCLIVDFNNGLI